MEPATTSTVAEEIERYLATGDTDPHRRAWAGPSFLARAGAADADLRNALVREVLDRTVGAFLPALPDEPELVTLVRSKVEPMVHGLFPRAEQDHVLALVERSVVFVTPQTVEGVLRAESFDRSAWDLANLFLHSLGAAPLSPDAPTPLGISQETRCFVTPRYFEEEDPYGDFVVHEVAHVFHNCKRERVGLPFSRRRERLLDIAYRRRETFAYACEAYSRVIEHGRRPADRLNHARIFGQQFRSGDERADDAEVAAIVEQAAAARNGWKVILNHCTEGIATNLSMT